MKFVRPDTEPEAADACALAPNDNFGLLSDRVTLRAPVPASCRPPAQRPNHLDDLRLSTSHPIPTPFQFLRALKQPDEIGQVGGYRVLRLLGQGGMAYVFLAEDSALRRRVALKIMKPCSIAILRPPNAFCAKPAHSLRSRTSMS